MLRGLAEVQRTCRVRRAIKILRARIAKIHFRRVDGRAVAGFGFVVDDCCVGAGGGDGVEGEADELVVFASHLFERVCCLHFV